jgi:hypothetical protein
MKSQELYGMYEWRISNWFGRHGVDFRFEKEMCWLMFKIVHVGFAMYLKLVHVQKGGKSSDSFAIPNLHRTMPQWTSGIIRRNMELALPSESNPSWAVWPSSKVHGSQIRGRSGFQDNWELGQTAWKWQNRPVDLRFPKKSQCMALYNIYVP